MSFLRPSDEPSVAIRQLSRWLEADAPPPLLIETSGSTGRPKGVVLQRRAVLASVEASARRLGGTGRWLLALPSSYVAGVQVIVRSLVAGHEPVVVEGLDVGRAVAADHAGNPTFASIVPTQLHRIVGDPEHAQHRERLRGKGFVQLDDLHPIDAETEAVQQLARRGRGAVRARPAR